jgi:hypothetical protein
MITGAQIRAARGLIRWTAVKLAHKAKLDVTTIRRSERQDGEPSIAMANAEAILRALEAAGVEFMNGGQPGVRLKCLGAWTMLVDQLNARNDE